MSRTLKNCGFYIKLSVGITAVIFLLFTFSACTKNEQTYQKSFYGFMGSSVEFCVITKPSSFFEKNKIDEFYKQTEAELNKLDKLFSTENAESEASRFNSTSKNIEIEVSPEFYEVFLLALEAHTATDGMFDVSIKPIVDLWGFSKRHTLLDYAPLEPYDRIREENGGFAPPDTIWKQALGNLVGSKSFLCEARDGKYYITKTGSAVTLDGKTFYQNIDLSGAVKGYAAKKLKNLAESFEFNTFWLSVGNSSMYLAENKESTDWALEIADPNSKLGYKLGTVNLKNQFVSTSGTYQHNYEYQGKVYHHIINPETLEPAETDILSATVVGVESALGDAISTALVIMGREKAVEFINSKYSSAEYIITTLDGKVYTNSDSFSLSSPNYVLGEV